MVAEADKREAVARCWERIATTPLGQDVLREHEAALYAEAARLGVTPRTIQRWIKQYGCAQ